MKDTNKPVRNKPIGTPLTDSAANHHTHISKIVDEHIQWLIEVSKLAFSAAGPAKKVPKTRTFGPWYRKAMQDLPEEHPLIDRLAVLHDQLHKAAAHALIKNTGGALDGTNYENICMHFNRFMEPLRAFEKSFNALAHGVDTETGLRSRYCLATDLSAEQKRMLRSGMPLTLVMIRLDDQQNIQLLHGDETLANASVVVAECILNTLRAYDDAYRLGTGMFLLCLKRTSEAEATNIIVRLEEGLANNPARLFGGGKLALSVSIATTAVTPDSDAGDLITSLKKQLAA